MNNLIVSDIKNKIHTIRGEQVILDSDLANLYNVKTRILNQAIKRNKERFPKGFMFQLNNMEYENLKSQIVTSSWGGRRHLPYAFTEQGVANCDTHNNYKNRSNHYKNRSIYKYVKLCKHMKPEEKVYKAYFKAKEKRLYFNELKELSGLGDSSLANTLKKMVNEKIIEKDVRKSNTYYEIKDKKIFALKFSEIAVEKFKELNLNVRIPLKNLKFSKETFTAVLFGSASIKEESKRSDIDLLVVGKVDKKDVVSKHKISVFNASINDFYENKDDVIIQARKTGFPIYGEQNFYEALLDEY